VTAPSVPDQLAIGVCIRRADVHRPLVAAAWAETRSQRHTGHGHYDTKL
jgi:LysR family positive regulator for ilvC